MERLARRSSDIVFSKLLDFSLVTISRQLVKAQILEKLPKNQGIGAKNLKKGSRRVTDKGRGLMDGVVS